MTSCPSRRTARCPSSWPGRSCRSSSWWPCSSSRRTPSRRWTPAAPNPPLTVDVTGFQWQWTFDYQAQGLSFTGQGTDGPVMVLPVGENVHFRLHSNDVIHSFYLPAFFFKKDVVPGRTNEFDLTLDQTGTYRRPVRRVLRPRPRRHALHRAGRLAGRLHRLGRQGAGGGQGDALAAAQRRAEPDPERLQHDRLRRVDPDGDGRPAVRGGLHQQRAAGGPPHDFAIKDPAGGSTCCSPASRWPRRARR